MDSQVKERADSAHDICMAEAGVAVGYSRTAIAALGERRPGDAEGPRRGRKQVGH